MEALIHELNLPANQGDPQRINEIQKSIQRLQRERTAWQLGIEFLQHDEAVVRFYGALTLTIKINADWYFLEPFSRQILLLMFQGTRTACRKILLCNHIFWKRS